SPGIGIHEDRVNIGTRDDNLRMEVSGFNSFHPQWLHFKLSDNIEYRNRFADRANSLFKPGGALTLDSCLVRYDKRMAEIDKAIIMESARWGDGRPWINESYHRDYHWIAAANKTRNYFIKNREDIFLEQLRSADLLSYLEAPVIEVNGSEVMGDELDFEDELQVLLKNENSRGLMCYTIDSGDPRLTGGDVNPEAEYSSSNVRLDIYQTSVIKVRILDQGKWSPLNILKCLSTEEDYTNLKLTEIHYNPLDSVLNADTISGNDYEFIEFKNTGDHSINLSGLKLDSAVYYAFPDGEVLLPDQFYVIVSEYVDFFKRYGRYASGVYSRNLSNAGELMILYDGYDNEVIRVTYSDQSPWPRIADGLGHSLVPTIVNPENNPISANYWLASLNVGGSPFANDGNSVVVNVNDLNTDYFTMYPNPASEYFIIGKSEARDADEIVVRMYDISGTLVMMQNSRFGERISLTGSRLIPGMYIVEVEGSGIYRREKLILLGR
ncbi:lamin tail domain-containing protein, partial [Bacteroidota bacterium]